MDGDFWYLVLRVCPSNVERIITVNSRSEFTIDNLRSKFSIFLDSSMVEHTAVNRGVVGSSPTRGVKVYKEAESL